jgi:type I restriction enzyme S subunit
MQGKLMPQDSNDESASVLLEKIKAEKERLIKEKKIKKDKPLPPITENEVPFEIPKNWVWCRLGKILHDLSYGTSKSCSYDNKKNSKVLRIPNISQGYIDIEDLKYTDLTEKDIKELSLQAGDILTIRSNGSRELVGKTVLVTEEVVGYTYAGYLIRLRFNNDLINPKFILKATNSPFYRELIETPLRTTVGINNINSTELSNLLIPLPPLSEQQRIVAKLDELMQYCDELEASIKESQQQNELLLQQVLREALEPKVKETVG